MKTLDDITVICASKYFTSDQMLTLYHKNISHFGENRTDVFLEKYNKLKEYPFVWHFIGHLQRNKAKDVIPYINYLHTLDSIELAKVIQKYRQEPLKCFIQVNATEENQKHGILLSEVDTFIKNIQIYDKIHIVGFMTMGKEDDEVVTNHAFKSLHELKKTYAYPYISMGMTDDLDIALANDTTHVRLGRYFKALLED
jgi:pyridoxal phosphate enzyme (YggS family)